MKTLMIMTWNVLYKEKADNILSLIREQAPDILCCQELTTESHFNPGVDMAAGVAKTLHADYEYKKAVDDVDEETGTRFIMGNGIFSRFPIKARRHVYVQDLDRTVKSYETERRVYVEVDLDINGQPLTVGTVHLSYVPHFTMTPKKLEEAKKLYAAITDNKKRYVLTGDMNAMPGSAIIERLSTMLNNAGPDLDQKTWTTKPFSYMGFNASSLDWRLDYIFTSPDIKVASSRILKTDFSDHLPVVAEIEI